MAPKRRTPAVAANTRPKRKRTATPKTQQQAILPVALDVVDPQPASTSAGHAPEALANPTVDTVHLASIINAGFTSLRDENAALVAKNDLLLKRVERLEASSSTQPDPPAPLLPPANFTMAAPPPPTLPGSLPQAFLEGAAVQPGNPDNCLDNRSIPVGLLVSAELRQAIKNDKYIFLSQLTHLDDDAGDTTVTINQTSGLKISKAKATYTPLSFPDWCGAWNTFTAIYLEEHADTAATLTGRLATHFETVHELYKEGDRWQYYDDTFRQLLEKKQATWGNIKTVIKTAASRRDHSQSTSTQSAVHYNSGAHATEMPFLGTGTCHKWHRGNRCKMSECRFTHVCVVCKKPGHPTIKCRRLNLQANPTAKPAFGKPKSRNGHHKQ